MYGTSSQEAAKKPPREPKTRTFKKRSRTDGVSVEPGPASLRPTRRRVKDLAADAVEAVRDGFAGVVVLAPFGVQQAAGPLVVLARTGVPLQDTRQVQRWLTTEATSEARFDSGGQPWTGFRVDLGGAQAAALLVAGGVHLEQRQRITAEARRLGATMGETRRRNEAERRRQREAEQAERSAQQRRMEEAVRRRREELAALG